MTKMLIAPILTVLTAVLVNKDFLEMVQFVKVCQCENLSAASSSRTAYPEYVALSFLSFLLSTIFVHRS